MLLREDAKTSREVFGGYIHTDTFKEGVDDQVILDLVYEARDIDQRLGSEDKIDEGLGDLAGNQDTVAETIETNVRKKIVKEQLTDPAFFERMLRLLDKLIDACRRKAV